MGAVFVVPKQKEKFRGKYPGRGENLNLGYPSGKARWDRGITVG